MAGIVALGLHWPALQVAAWFKMAADYRAQMSWTAAVEEAVAGPKCTMCLAIEDTRAGSRKAELLAPATLHNASLLLGLPPTVDDVMIPCARQWTWPVDAVRVALRRDTPPAPPPRVGT